MDVVITNIALEGRELVDVVGPTVASDRLPIRDYVRPVISFNNPVVVVGVLVRLVLNTVVNFCDPTTN